MKFENYQKARRKKEQSIVLDTAVPPKQDNIENDNDYYSLFKTSVPYQILITATMSAGKSTLINAIIGNNICKSQNLACTSQLHYIINKSFNMDFTPEYCDALIETAKNRFSLGEVAVSIVSYDSRLAEQRIAICDSPGVNYSGEIRHKQITDQMIRTEKYQMIIYLLNATQLGTTDDEAHLETIKKYADKKTILFVMNKIDLFNDEDGDIESIILKQSKYLESKGFHNPMICPVSAKTGLLVKKAQKEGLSKLEQRELNCLEDKLEQMKVAEYYMDYYPNIKISDNEDRYQQLLKICGLSYVEEIIKIFCEIGGVAAQVYVKYNPYRLTTFIEINGQEVGTDSRFYKMTRGKRLQEWIGEFPEMLINRLNTMNFKIKFCGMDLDWDDFEDVFQNAKSMDIVKTVEMKYMKGQAAEDITQKIVDIFNDLQNGPMDDFREPKLLRAFESVNEAEFPVNVIATMSSGKSTLVNALLGKRLMPSNNDTCTAMVTEILDNDKDHFTAVAYDREGNVIREIDELTYDIMSELNENDQVSRIEAEGDIPFLDAREIALMLVDTPSSNNSQNQQYKNTTYSSINNDSNSLILYVLNGTQLSTNDDNSLLNYVADQMKKGGKQVRDRFLFVINKMDGFNPEEEDIGKAIVSAKRYLYSHGIEDPQIFLCSALTALNIRSYLEGVDIDNLTRSEEKHLPFAARETLLIIDKFIKYESMHLEKYTTLSPSAQRELNYKLKQAQERNDTKEQALIHCGIYSIESAITAYVRKYAKTKKARDLVETVQEVLESNYVLAKAKEKIATDENAVKACVERVAIIKEKISQIKETQEFKQKIEAFDPIKAINEKAEALIKKAVKQVSRVFKPYGDTIHSKDEAMRLVNIFARISSDSIAEMAAELESVINHELIENSEQILLGYQEKLQKINENAAKTQLDFSTVDLIQGLTKMRESTETWRSDEFVSNTVEDVGEVEYEERSYYEKVGEEEKESIVGSHEGKIGTKSVKNSEKKWWKIFTPKYIEEDVYEDVDDYKDEDVYKAVMDYNTIMRDVYEERTETNEKFSADVSTMQIRLSTTLLRTLEEEKVKACSCAEKQVVAMKKQFVESLEKLDRLIVQKYEELEQCTKDQKVREEELERNKEILDWIETYKSEIDKILDM